MPKIPRYGSQARLRVEKPTTQPGLVKADPAAASLEARTAAQFFGAAQQVTENIYKLQAQNELSQANTKASQGRKTIETQTDDIEPTGWLERRNSDLKNLKQTISKDLKNPLARQQFNLEYDRDAIDTEFRLKKQYTGLTVGQTLNSFYTERDGIETDIYKATSDAERQLLINKIGNRYTELGRLGAMTPASAVGDFRKWQDDLIKGKVKNDIATNPVAAKENLLAGNYKNLSADETSKFIETSTKVINKINKAADQKLLIDQSVNEGDTSMRILNGELSIKDIEMSVKTQSISEQLGQALIRVRLSPSTVNAKTDTKEFLSLSKAFFSTDPTDLKAVRKNRINVLATHATGKLSRDDTNTLLNLTIDPTYQPIEKNSLSLALKNAINYMGGFARLQGLNIENATYDMIQKLIASPNINTPEGIKAETKAIVDSKMREIAPSTDTLKEIPNGVTSQDKDLNISNVNNTQIKPTHIWRDGKLVKVK